MEWDLGLIASRLMVLPQPSLLIQELAMAGSSRRYYRIVLGVVDGDRLCDGRRFLLPGRPV